MVVACFANLATAIFSRFFGIVALPSIPQSGVQEGKKRTLPARHTVRIMLSAAQIHKYIFLDVEARRLV
jgi:hypothetical protein